MSELQGEMKNSRQKIQKPGMKIFFVESKPERQETTVEPENEPENGNPNPEENSDSAQNAEENQKNTGDSVAYNDRVARNIQEDSFSQPALYIIRDGNQVFKPGMKTYFVDSADEKTFQASVVSGTVCTCNMVCTCNTEHTIVHMTEETAGKSTEKENTSVSDAKSAAGANPVNGDRLCTCNKVCSCVPVH